jgi:uncharacterized protein YyaL (SSP411 family)
MASLRRAFDGSTDTEALPNVVRGRYQPFQAVAVGEPGVLLPVVALLQDRSLVDRHAAAYVCRSFACKTPVTGSKGLQAQLK